MLVTKKKKFPRILKPTEGNFFFLDFFFINRKKKQFFFVHLGIKRMITNFCWNLNDFLSFFDRRNIRG